METKEQRPEQTDLAKFTHAPARPARGPLGTLTLVAFFGYAALVYITFFYALFVANAFIPPIALEVSLILLAAVVLAFLDLSFTFCSDLSSPTCPHQ